MRKLLLVFLFLVLLSNLPGCNPNEGFDALEEIFDGQTKGNQVIQALEEYYVWNGRYPEQLRDLIPNHLDEIPVTLAEKEFVFENSQSDIYLLSFPVTKNSGIGTGTMCTFIKRLEGWDCSQSFE